MACRRDDFVLDAAHVVLDSHSLNLLPQSEASAKHLAHGFDHQALLTSRGIIAILHDSPGQRSAVHPTCLSAQRGAEESGSKVNYFTRKVEVK